MLQPGGGAVVPDRDGLVLSSGVRQATATYLAALSKQRGVIASLQFEEPPPPLPPPPPAPPSPKTGRGAGV